MQIVFGSDTYGRVKVVGGTPIITKFVMLQLLPIWPLQSFYYCRAGERETAGIPFVASSQSVLIVGFPLTRIDVVSVAMAYVRGVFGALVLVGFMAIVPVIMHFTGEHLDELAMTLMRGLITSFIVGVVGGSLSYAIPLTTRRERGIRRYCGESLGICIDPARVSPTASRAIENFVGKLASHSADARNPSRSDLIGQLIAARLKIAEGLDPRELEWKTDRLLNRLRHM